MMIGLLAVLIFAGVPISTLAATYSGPAPADEYFGPHHQSILEIRNRLDRMDAKSDRELVDGNAVVELDDIAASISDWRSQYPEDPWLPRTYARLLRTYHRAGASSSDRAVAMLNDMKSAYPDAPETAAVIAMTFGGAGAAPMEFADAAPVSEPEYQQPVYQQPAYQQPTYAQPVYQQPVAVAPMLIPVATAMPPLLPSGAWARFDNMRGAPAPQAAAPMTKTTVTTTVTTTTTSGGPH
ncbi:MAG TPA: hypothetical protein VMB20_00990 [Candidatus Acidoferrum sp.]|nr:hypothetical protein [Candidatus Acidoferrum sp.]